MKVIKHLAILIGMFSIFLVGCSRDEIVPNGEVVYNHVNLSMDETDLYSYVGTMDYVFFGTVEEVVENEVDSNFPYMIYQVKVNENLKGNLVDTVEVKKQGGYNNDGTLILNETDKSRDNGLPEVNKQYIFMTYAQPDGSLLLAEINGNVEVTDELIKKDYQDYIKKEIKENRERFISKYDVNSK